MFRQYEYLIEKHEEGLLPGVKNIYRVRDRFKLDELIRDIRSAEFPCIAVEINNGGRLSLKNGIFDQSVHTFHVLDTIDQRNRDASTIQAATERCYAIGRSIMKIIKSDSLELNSPCYGLDDENILYDNIGPIGMDCYGATYNYSIRTDNVPE